MEGPHPHPYLHDPLLYITTLPAYISDESLAVSFLTCGPLRPKIQREPNATFVSGTIEFKFLEKAEKALATLQSRPVPGILPPVHLVLSPYPPTNPPTPLPPPSAVPRLVKHMPPGYSDSQLYDLFRPYGALASVRTQTHFGPDTGLIEFWNEEDARNAEEALHCADVEGQNIAVQIYQPKRTASGSIPEFNANAPTFIPGSIYPYPTQYSPPRQHPYSPRGGVSPLPHFVHGPGQQVQLAPSSGPGSNSHSGLIDPCNLFCKNLDPEIDSNGLFAQFRKYGQIVSARVMRNENGESRGFGFVSFQTPDQAAAALHSMNGVLIGSKQIVVRLHEPKQLRQEKLAHRFSGHGNGHPRSASGATSPTASEGGDSYGYGSPRHVSSSLGSPVGSGAMGLSSVERERQDRGRRGSGSYYNAALSGTLNLPMKYDDLAALSPVVRREVLTGELSRRVKNLGTVPISEIDSVVESLIAASLSEVVKVIDDPGKLAEQVKSVQSNQADTQSNEEETQSRSTSQDSRLLDPNALAATASAPEHPSTPISVNASLMSTPPRTTSPSGSLPPVSERDKMLTAVSKFEADVNKRELLTDLLMGLPKRERAMCLFNTEVLRAKIEDAKVVLESEEEEAQAQAPAPPPVTPKKKATAKPVEDGSSPLTPDLSSRGPSATSSPLPGTPTPAPGGSFAVTSLSSKAPQYTDIASLAKLPAAEIVRLATKEGTIAAGLLPKPDPLVVATTDEFIDGLMGQQPHQQKQQLGDKLFKVIKSFGIKSAPKVTIQLLDQEDLRALAHLMNSYSVVLKDKAQTVISTK
ncbi:hypothetical protein E1B28_005699 [Marasmius oreades]|uniref:RRM domain-containing protein n=1 Tax=Marasmius oreades TaxID=181124 RepID=A0A9P7UUI6_9AGAR|nr:uncharacterized protein E1B28_005699 [Marasmius oreades]KAG7094892.1 hypothetical protein E1B28_005699 [Marasmius oreades]